MSATDAIATARGVASVRAVQRAATILKCFEGRGLLGLADVARAAALDKGTTRRLLLTMMKDGLVARDPASERYGLGPLIRRLAADVHLELDLRALAAPALAELAAELQITAFLSVYRDGEAICLDRLHDMKGMEVRWWAIGGALPLNCGGAPKLLLAFQDEEEIVRALRRPLPAMTPRSVVDPQKLKAHLRLVRRRGWDMAVDDVAVGLTALAAPVLDRSGALVCAVSMAGLTPQMVARGKPVHLDRLRRAAARIAARLP